MFSEMFSECSTSQYHNLDNNEKQEYKILRKITVSATSSCFSSNLVDLNKFLSFELAACLLSLAKAVNFLQKSNEPNLAAETIAKIAKEKSCRDHDSDNQIENK